MRRPSRGWRPPCDPAGGLSSTSSTRRRCCRTWRREAGPFLPGERGSRLRKYLSPDQLYVIKEIHLADGRQFSERVRLYHAAELEAMLAAAGVVIEQRFGDYQGARCIDGAPRALLIGRAA